MEEMSRGGRELVATYESAILAKQFLDAIVVEGSQNGRCLANSTSADESGWSEVFCQIDDLLNPSVTSEAAPWWRWWGFSRWWPDFNLSNSERLL